MPPHKWGTYNSYHISCLVDLYMSKALRPSYVLMMIYLWKRAAEHLFGVWWCICGPWVQGSCVLLSYTIWSNGLLVVGRLCGAEKPLAHADTGVTKDLL